MRMTLVIEDRIALTTGGAITIKSFLLILASALLSSCALPKYETQYAKLDGTRTDQRAASTLAQGCTAEGQLYAANEVSMPIQEDFQGDINVSGSEALAYVSLRSAITLAENERNNLARVYTENCMFENGFAPVQVCVANCSF